jgi:hypothetical protein
LVTPAKAGVQEFIALLSSTFWIPAFAGMMVVYDSVHFQQYT